MICWKGKRIHFIGIGGMGVNALAKYMLDNGAIVNGSDARINELCEQLKSRGAKIFEGVDASLIDGVDIVVYSSAIKEDNAELAYARELGIEVFERQQFLRKVAAEYENIVGIAGTHGKTTSTAMLTHILKACGVGFVGMIGGDSVEFGNYVNNSSKGSCDIFVTEACEYKRNFLTLKPTIAVVTNVECDHPDSYANYADVRSAFDEYLARAKVKIYFDESGVGQDLKIIVESDTTKTIYTFSYHGDNCGLSEDGKFVCDITLADGCEYNYKNAAIAVVTAKALGVDLRDSVEALKSFGGVKRRFEYAGSLCGTPIYFDFAHHPTEIASVLKRAAGFGRILAIFQPHTYSRTKAYFDDFVNTLGRNKNIGSLLIMPTYAARERYDGEYDYEQLAKAIADRCGKQNVYAADETCVIEYVRKHADEYDIILFIGAGDIYDLKCHFTK